MLPSGWTFAALGAVSDVKLGKMLSPKAQEAGLTRLRYLRNENVRWGRIDLDDLKEMGFKSDEIARYTVEVGDLLVCEGGEPGRAAVYQGPDRLAYQKALHRVRPATKDISTSLLRYWLEHLARSGLLVEKIAQTTIQHLPLERFQAVEFPIPPAVEQHRIVAAIEEHLSRVDAGVDSLERVKKELARYRASVLRAACEGSLVPTEAALARAEGRSYEPASELLARIIAGRRTRRSDRTEPTAHDSFALSDLPEGWVWGTLAQLTEIQGGIQKQPSRAPKSNAFPFLRVANVKRGTLDLSEIHRIELRPGELERLRLEKGDLLIVEGNGSPGEIGRMAIWNDAISDCVHQNHIIRARPFSEVLSAYASAYWNSPDGSARVLNVASSTSGLFTLSVGKISVLPIPLPPLAEQYRIVAEVERRLSIADGVAAAVDFALTRAARLRQSILKRAFEGRLVPQDPNDEPASILLERIRAERAAAEPETRRASARRVTGSVTTRGNASRKRTKAR